MSTVLRANYVFLLLQLRYPRDSFEMRTMWTFCVATLFDVDRILLILIKYSLCFICNMPNIISYTYMIQERERGKKDMGTPDLPLRIQRW